MAVGRENVPICVRTKGALTACQRISAADALRMAASLGNGVDPRSGGVAVPMDWMPLGDYEAFQSWSGRPRSWGPSDVGWRAWFGGQVIDGLCSVLDEHLAAYLPAPVPSLALATGRGVPAAIGCVPWLTSAAVVDCLFKLGACCIVIDKGTLRPPAIRLLDSHLGFPNVALPQLENVTPAVNGEPMIVGPGTPREAMEHELEPVRVLGVRDRDSRKPLLHAKLSCSAKSGGSPTLPPAPRSLRSCALCLNRFGGVRGIGPRDRGRISKWASCPTIPRLSARLRTSLQR